MFHGHLDYFQKPPFGDRPNIKPGDHGNLNAHHHWFILFYHVQKPTWIEIYWNSIGWGLVAYGFTLDLKVCDHTTWCWRWVGTAFGHFLWALTMSWSRLLARVWSGPKLSKFGLKLEIPSKERRNQSVTILDTCKGPFFYFYFLFCF